MLFVTTKGCSNHDLKLKLGKNDHSNKSIWLAVRQLTAHGRRLITRKLSKSSRVAYVIHAILRKSAFILREMDLELVVDYETVFQFC